MFLGMVDIIDGIRVIENNHITNIEKNSTYMSVIEMIIGDVLMGKVKKTADGSLKLFNITPVVERLIDNWSIMANDLKQYNDCCFNVYRGVSNMEDTDIIVQPLPFSTCIDYENARNWVYTDGFIMDINIKVGDLYTFTGNEYEGREVVLAPCTLKKISTTTKDGITVNKYDII